MVAKDVKVLQTRRPKLGTKELVMEPDEQVYLQAVHGENRFSVGSIDPKDTYFHVIKTPGKWKDRKPLRDELSLAMLPSKTCLVCPCCRKVQCSRRLRRNVELSAATRGRLA